MTARIKLDLVSDIVCPWCIIGYKRLQQAIKASGAEDRIDIEWQPFELNPGMPAEGENLRAHIARKYGSSAEEYQRTQANLEQLGTELDFRFDFFDDMNIVNTEDAHILLDYAKDFGKQSCNCACLTLTSTSAKTFPTGKCCKLSCSHWAWTPKSRCCDWTATKPTNE